MAKSKPKPEPKPSIPSPDPLSDALIDIDHVEADSSKGSSSASSPRQDTDGLYPCIFHLYFETCENVDCKFSHSTKAISSRPPSRTTSPLSPNGGPLRSPFKKSTFQPRGGAPQPCRHFLKGNCRYGDRCRDSHEVPKSKTDIPWRGAPNPRGDRTSAGTSPTLPEPPRLEARTVNLALVVPKVEVRVARNEEVFDDVRDQQNEDESPTKADLSPSDSPGLEYAPAPPPDSPGLEYTPAPPPDSPSLEYAPVPPPGSPGLGYAPLPPRQESPPAEGMPPLSSTSHHDANVHVEGDPNPTYADDWDGVDPDADDSPESNHDQADTREIASPELPVDGNLGDEGGGGDDDDDKWGWNEDPQVKKEEDGSKQVQELWSFKGSRREDIDFEVELEHTPGRTDAEEKPIDSAWGQPPDNEVHNPDPDHVRESWEEDSENSDPTVDDAQGGQDQASNYGEEPDEDHQIYDAQDAISERVEEPDAGDEDYDIQYPVHQPEDEPVPLDASGVVDEPRQTPAYRPPSLRPSVQARSSTRSVASVQARPSTRSAATVQARPSTRSAASVQARSSTRSVPSMKTPASRTATPTSLAAARIPSPVPSAATTPPRVLASAAPSLPPPIPVSDARQTSMMSLHWCRFADPTIDPDVAFCKAFAQNKCSNAASDACTFRHCLTLQEYTLLFKDPQPLQFSLQKSLIRNDSPANANLITSPSFALHWSHFADPSADPQIAFCKPYAEHTCPNDTACGFRHCLTLEEYTFLFKDPQPNLISISGTAGGHSAVPQHQQKPSSQRKAPCVFFVNGKCKNGSNCPWSHECPNKGSCNDTSCFFCLGAQSTSNPTSKKLCTFWPQGKCKNGDGCQFTHIGESGAALTSGDAGGGGGDANWDGTWGDTTGNNQGDEWAANGDTNGWGTGNVNGDDNNHEQDADEDNHQEVANDQNQEVENDQNQDAGWGDNNNTAPGWDDQVNASGWTENGGWGGQNNDGGGWGTQNNDSGGWGAQNNDKSSWENQNNGNSGRAEQNDNWRRRDNRFNVQRDNARYSGKHNSRDNGYNGRSGEAKKSNVCYTFKQKGRCHRGSDCRFSHDLEQGGSSGHGSRDASRPYQSRNDTTPPAPTVNPVVEDPAPTVNPVVEDLAPLVSPRALSAYGGRSQYDRSYIDEWQREVAASSFGSEAGGSQAPGRRRDSGSQSGTRGRNRASDNNRSVERPPTGDPCQFYLLGRCTIGDTCPSSHDPVVPETGVNKRANKELGLAVREARQLRKVEGERGEVYDGTPDDEVEDIAGNDDTSANQIVDSKWGRDNQWDDEPVRVPDEEIQIDKPCLLYGQGFCPDGDLCRFVHVEPEQPSPEESAKDQRLADQNGEEGVSEPGTRDHVSDINPQTELRERDYGHPFIEDSMYGCAVVFGRDCLPDKVTTGTDSHILILEGPPDILEARVHDLVHRYGPIKDITITPEQPQADEGSEDDEQDEEGSQNRPQKSVIRVEFKETKDAAAAVRGLRALNVKLADAIPIELVPMTSAWVRFRWPQATRAAWIYYSSITKAKTMAEKLHGTLFQGRKITASFLRPDKRQKDLYAIKLERLPADTTRVDLADLGQDSKLITVSELTYTENPREALQQSTGVKAFVNILENPAKINAVAFACLDSESSLFQALQMHGTKPKFLGKQELVAERVWFAYYGLPTDAFKPVSTEVAALQVKYEGRAQVEWCDFGDHFMIYLHAPHEETAIFVQANLSLQAICYGMVVTVSDDQPEWDDYFYSTSSIKVIENLNSKNSFYIFPNLSSRQIHVLGSGINQDKGVLMVKKLLQKVRGSCQEHPIHRNVLRQLIDGGLTEIQGDVGANKLSLDVLRSVLVVRGGDGVLMQRIRHLLEFSPSKEIDDKSNSRALCSVCELQPGGGESNPIVKLFCGHVYCGACLKNALISAAENRSAPVKCIGRGPPGESEGKSIMCNQSIAYTTVRDLLPLRLEPEYRKAAFLSFIHSNLDDYFFCPSLRCDAVYRRVGEPGNNIRCPICRAWVCLFCGSLTHDGVECEKAQEIRVNIRN